jgi:hypothetical protein
MRRIDLWKSRLVRLVRMVAWVYAMVGLATLGLMGSWLAVRLNVVELAVVLGLWVGSFFWTVVPAYRRLTRKGDD